MDFKAFSDGLDKLTDILNVGRLVFYTAAGFCVSLPLAMILRVLARHPLPAYGAELLSDVSACSKHPGVWLAALILGFLVASVAGAVVSCEKPAQAPFDKQGFAYHFPRLFSGGVPDKSASKDYAAWLISEYYRYYEIVLYIPSGILVALPLCTIYSLFYLLRTNDPSTGFTFTPAHWALGFWALASIVAWDIVWPQFWRPMVVQRIYEMWVEARRETIAGLREFVAEAQKQDDKTPKS